MIRSMLVDQPYWLDNQNGRGLEQTVGYNCLLDAASEGLFEPVGRWLVKLVHLGKDLLFLVVIVKLEVLLVGTSELESLELGQLWHGVLVNRVDVVQHLVSLLLQALKVWGLLDSLLGLTRDVVDGLLALLHARDVLLERGEVVTTLG